MAISGWPSKVSWSQFRKLKTHPAGATTDAHIEGNYANPPGKQFQPTEGADGWRLENVHFVVKLTPAKTWVVKGMESKAMLNHEQGHWNILGLLVRELEADIKAIRTKKANELAARLKAARDRIDAKGKRIGSSTGRYDKETNHGLNKAQQATWDKLIANCMSSGKHLPDR